MAEVGIDRSKLPGVKEVCRDFAVREDHTLAHSLQEQEIEHHLATNIQRNRLAKHDLQMAKQLQEEEDRQARSRLQGQHKDLERQDCEIAQEIQVKLVIEAEQQRRQEEDDEGIARILQRKEVQEEKRRKKPPLEASRPAPSEGGRHMENRDPLLKLPRPGSADGQPPMQTREPWRGGPPFISEGLDLETWESSSEAKKRKDGRRKDREKQPRERKKDGHQRLHQKDPPDLQEEGDEEDVPPFDRARQRHPNRSPERNRGPFLLALDAEAPRAVAGRSRDPNSRERPQRTPPPLTDREEEWRSGHGGQGPRGPTPDGRGRHVESRSPNPGRREGPPREDPGFLRSPAHHAGDPHSDAAHRRQPRREDGEWGSRASPTSPHRRGGRGAEEGRRPQNAETKSRGSKEDTCARPRGGAPHDPQSYDAEIAWKLQEEELLASQVDRRAAQVAQDEEIAHLLMAEEKKAYRKAKDREKRRQDQEWKEPPESGCGRSREGYDPHRGRSEKPTRTAPPSARDFEPPSGLPNQHDVGHQITKSESGHKGQLYRQ